MRIHKFFLLFVSIFTCALSAQSKPKLAFDEFFDSVGFRAVEISPDGSSIVLCTERADWDQQIFRTDLWLYHDDGKGGAPSLIQLTQSGHDSEPKWSPDGRWIAFLSERKTSSAKDADAGDEGDVSDPSADPKDSTQLYLISPTGGEALAISEGDEEIHAFSWSAASQTIYFATRHPWTYTQKSAYKKDWKDVVQYRTAERGDTLFALDLAGALARRRAAPATHSAKRDRDKDKDKDKDKDDDRDEAPDTTPGAVPIATSPLRIDDLTVSPDGRKIAFASNAINQRQEKYADVELYVIDLARLGAGDSPASAASETSLASPHRVTTNTAVETRPHWASDSRHIFFTVEIGDVAGPYRDLQPHLYWVDTESSKVEQWAQDFTGQVEHYAVEGAGTVVRRASRFPVLASARMGTEVQLYSVSNPSDPLHKLTTWPGTYSTISTATDSSKVAFIYSSLGKPEEIYLADSADKLDQARPITTFNKLFAERDLPQGKPYQWKADDGTTVEGMLIYPPGKFEAKDLPMFTLIHGGPADADGNHFAADWYDWAALAATNGWLVFRPNYRGSTGYGDKFLLQIVPQIVSRPGNDILEGVDALVKDGIADPDHLTIGGYSYGGYMTNWLITQTTRFKAAVTGAGAVEHIGNWGNDDTTYDDAYFLGGRPWEAPQRYHDEAAIFQIDKVKTPTHMVAGADDIRVAVLEDYLLEHALYSLGIPNKLLIFPGEGHSLAKNPWHGKIKVREELKWLQKYGGVPAN